MSSAITDEPWGPPWPAARAALAWATWHLKLNWEHQHVLGNGRDPFFPLIAVETGCGMWSMRRWLDRFLKMVGAASGVALASAAVLAAVVTMGGPPPSSSLTREALIQRVNSVTSGGLWWLGFEWQWRWVKLLFIRGKVRCIMLGL
jgi:hypothetical protein